MKLPILTLQCRPNDMISCSGEIQNYHFYIHLMKLKKIDSRETKVLPDVVVVVISVIHGVVVVETDLYH